VLVAGGTSRVDAGGRRDDRTGPPITLARYSGTLSLPKTCPRSCGEPGVAMMQSAEFGKAHDLPRALDSAVFRRVLPQCEVVPWPVVVVEIGAQQALEVRLLEHDGRD